MFISTIMIVGAYWPGTSKTFIVAEGRHGRKNRRGGGGNILPTKKKIKSLKTTYKSVYNDKAEIRS